MKQIPSPLNKQFETLLVKNNIPQRERLHYFKWLRYYLDFCSKYGFSESDTQSLSRFIHKLKEKKQTVPQQNQAAKAIHLFYGLINLKVGIHKKQPVQQAQKTLTVKEPHVSYKAPPPAKLQPSSIKPDYASKESARNLPTKTGTQRSPICKKK